MTIPKAAGGLVLVGLGVGAVYLNLAARSEQDKPTRQVTIVTEFKGPPPTLSEMVREADAVITGRIVGTTPHDVFEPRFNDQSVMTMYRVRVSQVLQAFGGYNIDPREIGVLRVGGVRDRGSYLEQTVQEDFPPFHTGSDYLLFLNWDKAHEAWIVAFGPDGAFELSGHGVAALGVTPVAKSVASTNTLTLIDSILRLKN